MPRAFTELTDAQLAEVETLAAVLSTQQMADYFGMGRTTFYGLMDRDPEVAERYKRGRARAVGAVAQSLIAKARSGNVTAMIFFLKTQAGWRETERHEVSVGPTINVVDSFGAEGTLSDRDLERFSDEALERILTSLKTIQTEYEVIEGRDEAAEGRATR